MKVIFGYWTIWTLADKYVSIVLLSLWWTKYDSHFTRLSSPSNTKLSYWVLVLRMCVSHSCSIINWGSYCFTNSSIAFFFNEFSVSHLLTFHEIIFKYFSCGASEKSRWITWTDHYVIRFDQISDLILKRINRNQGTQKLKATNWSFLDT